MEILTGYLYHIKNSSFDEANEPNLISNKEDKRLRPTYFTIKDNNILWFIPLSTKVEKYQSIINKKISKYGSCKTIINDDTERRYKLLKGKVISELLKQIDDKVYKCCSCKELVEKFPNDQTVFIGKDNNILLVEEAPANNGWRKSHKSWCDTNGKVLPSGVVLQKLFDIIDRNIFEITFLESVKCYPVERKNLKVCSKNCKNIMLEQIKILNPKLIITLGEFPTRNLLDFKFEEFADVVGNNYEQNDYKILPIYHSSPISPKR